MAAFRLDIVTPEKTFYSGEVERLQAPGSEGSFGVLARHTPLLTALQVGSMTFAEEAGDQRQVAVSGGFVEVRRDGVAVLAETAEFAEEIDAARARQARDRAQERLGRRDDDEIDATRAEVSLMRALNRLNVIGDH